MAFEINSFRDSPPSSMPLFTALIYHVAARALLPALVHSETAATGASNILWPVDNLVCYHPSAETGHAEQAEQMIRAAWAGAPVNVEV
jgi:hypothetical protein